MQMWLDFHMVYGHIYISAVLDHLALELWICFKVCSCKSLILFPALPFLKVGVDYKELDHLSLISDCLHEQIFLKSSIFGMAMTDIDSHFLDVSLKSPLVLNRIFRGEVFMKMYIDKIAVVIHKYLCYVVELLGRSALRLVNENQSG